MKNTAILTLSCKDTVGIVATVSQFITNAGAMIIEASQHGDLQSKWFFMRVVFDKDTLNISLDEFKTTFETIAEKFSMQWELNDKAKKPKVIILASKHQHCLADLLYRYRTQELACEIAAVISNHKDCKDMVKWHGIDFHYVPITLETKTKAYQKIESIIDKHDPDLITLARFMQIIPSSLCEKYHGKMINIHHSFLPSFIGADPYAKAYEHGVKLIGATSHFVTEQLDEGPIIEQDVIRINHSNTLEDMVRLGRDVEKLVLARAVRAFIENRILLHENKTIVFV